MPFSVVIEEEQDRLKVNEFTVKAFRNHPDIANLYIILNAMYSFDKLDLDMSTGHEAGFKQSYKLLNGLKTSKEEIVRSFMIKVYFPYYTKDKVNKSKLARITHKIAESFFPSIVYPRKTKDGNSSYTVGLTPRSFKYRLYIKTALNSNLIYAYDHKGLYTYLIKGTIDDALKFIKKSYADVGFDDVVNDPLFDRTMRKILVHPIYPL